MARGRHVSRHRHRALYITLGVIAGVLLLAAGGVAYAATRYERAHADRILPGVTIDGIDVSGMTRTEATAAVRSSADATLSEPLTISVGNQHWTVTAETLGRRAAIAGAVRQALSAGDDLGTFDRAWRRVRNEPMQLDVALSFQTRGDAIQQLVTTIAKKVAVQPRDAAITLAPDQSDIVLVHPKSGSKLNVGQAETAIGAALEDGSTSLELPTREVQPAVTEQNMGRTIVVRVNENRLYLYDGYRVIRTYPVATAKPGYVTPVGDWKIYDKRKDPTWYNPALDTWGANEPAVVPGGPGNPLGPRAIYITAPGLIRIHGNVDDASIGRYASHGCIRMHNQDVIALFDMIDVGQHVIIVGKRPASAAYWSMPSSAN